MAKKNKILIICLFFFIQSAKAGMLIRDAETEDYIRLMLDEILVASNIPPHTINLFLLKEDDINAFVYNGPNLFINTGLIQSAQNYEIVQAVIAHEVGHIKGSHIINMNINAKNAISEALFYSAAGALIALTGGGASAAIITGLSVGSNVAEKRFLGYTRTQEKEADYHASETLYKLKSSGKGAIEVFEKFKEIQEKHIDVTKIDKYRTTHPFPEERLDYFKKKFSDIHYKPVFRKEWQKKHLLVIAKLAGYFNNMQNLYSDSFMQDEEAKLYFEGFAEFRKTNFKEAIKIFQQLSNANPQNPYFYEAIAFSLQKNQEFKESINFYHKALQYNSKNFNFLFGISESYFLSKNYKMAIKYMLEASVIEPYNPQVSYKLASFYNASGELLIAKIFFLESEVLRENYPKAKEILRQIKADNNFKNNKLSLNYKQKVLHIEEMLKNK